MSKIIRNFLKRYLMKDICKDYLFFEDSYNVKTFPNVYFNSFGGRNPDKMFYVIWLDKLGSGFFSNLSAVLCHLKIADSLGMIPVIDFQNFKTLYNVNTPINNTRNAWEYYFYPVSTFSLDEIYSSRNVFFGGGSYPASMSYNITEIDSLDETYKKYVFLQSNVENRLRQYSELFNRRVLGVHFRGKEQNIAPSHSFAPTEKQMIKYADEIIGKYNIEKIFIVTEEQRYLDLFINNYGEQVLYTDSFRSYKINSYNLKPRENHRYLLGLEVLVDAQLLSMCTGILCGDSNVSEYARFINNQKYEFIYKINNGINSRSLVMARYAYRIKKRLPSNLGGLLDIVERVGS